MVSLSRGMVISAIELLLGIIKQSAVGSRQSAVLDYLLLPIADCLLEQHLTCNAGTVHHLADGIDQILGTGLRGSRKLLGVGQRNFKASYTQHRCVEIVER